MKLILLAGAGALGTLSRYGLTVFVHWLVGPGFPWGTLAVNLLGCFLFGLFWPLAEEAGRLTPDVHFVVLGGFMGAFTTFSTLAFDSSVYLQDGRWPAALANLALTNVAGILMMLIGLIIGNRL